MHGRHRETPIVCPVKHKTAAVYLPGQDGRWQLPDITAALLVRPIGTIWTLMDLQGQKNAACESRIGYL